MRTSGVVIVTTLVTLALAVPSWAAPTPEQRCQQVRYTEAGKYGACHQKEFAKAYGARSHDLQFKLARCTTKYTGKWPRLRAQAGGTGATCDRDRFEDNGDGTVTDWLTGLQWEKKTDDASVHDKDNLYSWSATQVSTAADGTAFTSFLPALNSGGCFAGQCDWRLPTIAELMTILLATYPCATSPCIDEAVFGPTVADNYWTSNSDANRPIGVWAVRFEDGYVGGWDKDNGYYVRAVRFLW